MTSWCLTLEVQDSTETLIGGWCHVTIMMVMFSQVRIKPGEQPLSVSSGTGGGMQ